MAKSAERIGDLRFDRVYQKASVLAFVPGTSNSGGRCESTEPQLRLPTRFSEEEICMKWTVKLAALALAVSAPAALAQTTTPNVPAAPSTQNSGAGIAGQPGNKNGPAAKPGETVGSGSSASQPNPTVQTQDSSNIKGLPGGKSGPAVKQPDK
jgi:hypothetical protein